MQGSKPEGFKDPNNKNPEPTVGAIDESADDIIVDDSIATGAPIQNTPNNNMANNAGPVQMGPAQPMPNPAAREFYPPSRQPMMQQQGNMNPQQAQEQAPRKKHRGGKIAAIIIAILLLGGIAGAGVVLAIANQPDNIVKSAAKNLAEAENLSISGSVEASGTGGMMSLLESAKITFSSAVNSDSESNTEAELSITLSGQTLSLKLETVSIKDGKVYIKLDELKSAIATLLESFEFFSYNPVTADAYENISTVLNNLAGKIDGQWWVVNTTDEISTDDTGSDNQDMINGYYSCIYEAVTDEVSKKSEYEDLYNKNPFITISGHKGEIPSLKDRGRLYDASVDKAKLRSFIGSVTDRDFVKKLNGCQSTYFGTPAAEQQFDIDSVLNELQTPETLVVAFEGLFDQKLTGLYFEESMVDGSVIEGTIYIDYDRPTINAPAGAKNFSTISEEINQAFGEIGEAISQIALGFLGSLTGGACEGEDCLFGGFIDCGEDTECLEDYFDDYLDDIDYEEIFGENYEEILECLTNGECDYEEIFGDLEDFDGFFDI